MSILKTLVLASLLVVSGTASAQEHIVIRDRYFQLCTEAGIKAGNEPVQVLAVCNCSTQYLSYKLRPDQDKFGEVNVDLDSDLPGQSIELCVAMINKYPQQFMEIFGSVNASAR